MTVVARACSSSLRRLVLVALALSAPIAILTAHPARAEPAKTKQPRGNPRKTLSQTLTGAAKADFDAGKLLASDEDYSGALIKFSSAYESSKDPRLLWNLAFCHKNLRHYAKVLSILRRYLDEGGTALTVGDRTEASDLITLIEPFTTRVAFQVTPDGATITVDGELLGTSPLATPAVLDIGERRIRITKDGYLSFEKGLAVGGTSEVTFQANLEKEVHQGRLLVNAQGNAQIFLDGNPAATGKLDLPIPSGGHQLRVVAPGMRPYQTEVVVSDRETRSVEVVLEAAAPSAKPRISVAVGCTDTNPRAPEEGLVVRLDGTDMLSPALVKRRHDDLLAMDVVERVEYEVPQGLHELRVGITDCEPREEVIHVAPDGGTRITGALRSDRALLLRGPLGSPGWYRVSLGAWLPFTSLHGGRGEMPEDYSGRLGSSGGLALELGLVSRWFGVFLGGAWASGSFDRESHAMRYAVLPESASGSWKELSLRLGPRFPFNIVAIGLGPSISLQALDLDQVRTGHVSGVVGGFFELDIQPLCDWGLYLLENGGYSPDDDRPSIALSAGLMYQPSARCHAERETQYGLVVHP